MVILFPLFPIIIILFPIIISIVANYKALVWVHVFHFFFFFSKVSVYITQKSHKPGQKWEKEK